ncbi:hypothetical protein N7507_011298 [Penicillium longicatenatum]|nr:hypothetical protein N7507_011298 [Penicillium longicatenatum]
MKVLVLGSTGRLGSRVLSALLARGHSVVAFARDSSKLPPSIISQLLAVELGDATKSAEITAAGKKHQCDAIVNTAGYAAMAPWGKSDLPSIVDAVITAALEMSQDRESPLRVWFLGGLGLLDLPNTNYRIVDYLRMFPQHQHTWAKLQALPPSGIQWSVLCPGQMYPMSAMTYPVPNEASAENLSVASTSPPEWSSKLLGIPLIGGYLNILSQASSYKTALEEDADFIAQDLLEGAESPWMFQKVGTKNKTQ